MSGGAEVRARGPRPRSPSEVSTPGRHLGFSLLPSLFGVIPVPGQSEHQPQDEDVDLDGFNGSRVLGPSKFPLRGDESSLIKDLTNRYLEIWRIRPRQIVPC